MIISGLDVPKLLFIRNGTAIPTKEIGPAKAVTVADKILESKIKATRKNLMFTPMLVHKLLPADKHRWALTAGKSGSG